MLWIVLSHFSLVEALPRLLLRAATLALNVWEREHFLLDGRVSDCLDVPRLKLLLLPHHVVLLDQPVLYSLGPFFPNRITWLMPRSAVSFDIRWVTNWGEDGRAKLACILWIQVHRWNITRERPTSFLQKFYLFRGLHIRVAALVRWRLPRKRCFRHK